MSRKRRSVADRVVDILESIGNAESDIGSMAKDEFLNDGKTQRAVIESLIDI
ncbi:ribonuclease HepT family protein [Endothiovibrio diazotrophicus]